MAWRIGITLVSLTAWMGTPASLESQQVPPLQVSPFTILVPDFEPLYGADPDFGRRVAGRLRGLFDDLLRHEAISRRQIERSLDEVDKDMDDVDCILARRLAARMDARVVLCAAYEERANEEFAMTAVFYDVASGEAFWVEPMTRADREDALAAQRIFEQFDTYTRQLRAADNCHEYAQSRLWEDALRNCDEALSLNPDANGARYRRARILFDSERSEESLEELERVLERDPNHELALQLAGHLSATFNRSDNALGYYSRYLRLNPGNASVRMRVAYELATAGDSRGALLLIREGLDIDSDNADLWEQLGGYSFTIGERINREAPVEDGGALAPDAVEYFRNAIEAYGHVLEARGAETNPRHLRGIVIAYVRLGEVSAAITTAERALETHSGDAALWSIYADALRGAERLDEALHALSTVLAIDPEYRNVGLRRGDWLLDVGRVDEAVDALRAVAAKEPDRADAAARLVLAHAHSKGVQQDHFEYAIQVISPVKDLPNLSQATVHELNFWHGYSVLRAAAAEQEPRTLATARAALPRFEEALQLLEEVGEYPSAVNVDIESLRADVRTFIDIQRAIIRRGC